MLCGLFLVSSAENVLNYPGFDCTPNYVDELQCGRLVWVDLVVYLVDLQNSHSLFNCHELKSFA